MKESTKRSRLLGLLEELVTEGRKVLVFSQFVEMLRVVAADVVARDWDYAMLHGATKDRDEQISGFPSGGKPLFLISLKAGGTGLNLTAADTVIVYDPWWNPAVERQAMDRAHRIGQDKPVFVHRLIAENTVEAAIQTMQRRKQALADALFEGTPGSARAHRGRPACWSRRSCPSLTRSTTGQCVPVTSSGDELPGAERFQGGRLRRSQPFNVSSRPELG